MIDSTQTANQVYYLTSFNLLTNRDIELLCSYKQFVESTIIELGEDWRIESGLLSHEISAIIKQTMTAEADQPLEQRLEFNIFNEFMLPFLKGKLGHEKETCEISDSIIQEQYAEDLNHHFELNSKITESLTFKTLSLGFCIKAVDMWVKNFHSLSDHENNAPTVEPLGILQKHYDKQIVDKKNYENRSSIGTSTIRNNLSNIDLGSCHQSNSQMEDKNYKPATQKKWFMLQSLKEFSPEQIKGIQHSLTKAKYSKMQVLSNFAVNLHELKTEQKRVRILSVNNQFYRKAFIVWLIFNIKLFFSITFEQYSLYFRKLTEDWFVELEGPLKKFYMIIQKQWSLLLKDYSVALHDDLEVLKSLILRVRKSLTEIWKVKQEQIEKKLIN